MDSNRRLVVIMFTDIVGYTALMGSDQDAALEILSKNRVIHKSAIEHWGGRLLKEMGDGNLASFTSTLDAVYCAGSIQNPIQEALQKTQPSDGLGVDPELVERIE